MNRQEVIEEIEKLADNGADIVELFEWVEDNTDLDPADIVHEIIYKKRRK